MSFEQTQAYDAKLVTLLETLWGAGYLSPGGDAETALVLEGLATPPRHILDIGCGTGGSALFIAERFPGAQVLGIDVEGNVIDKARRGAEERGLATRVEFRRIDPGPLPLPDAAFDLVFSKDAIVHIEDKQAIAREIARVLRPAGVLAMSDWMAGSERPMSPELKRYVELEGLGFGLASPDRYFAALRAAGFERIAYRDRTAWYADLTRSELAALRGPLYEGLSTAVGKDFLDHEIEVWSALDLVLSRAELGPGHWRAVRKG